MRLTVIACSLLFAGCTWPWPTLTDSGDGGGVDASRLDASMLDASRSDASLDASLDAGPLEMDAGPPNDGAPPIDAGAPDAGVETCRVGGFDGEACGAQRCTRPVSPSLDRDCCEVGRCVPAPDRVLAWSEQTSGAPTIDGRQDIEYNLTKRIYLTVVDSIGAGVPDGTDITASFISVWNSTHLFVLFEIIDDRIFDSAATTWLDDDAIELSIDFDPSTGGPGARMILSLNRTAPEHLASPITTQYAARRDAMQPNYWLAEIAIPWPGGAPPRIGDAITFDVTLHDVDAMGSTSRDRWMYSPACTLSVPAPTALMVFEGIDATGAQECVHTACAHGGCAVPGWECLRANATECP